MNKYQIGDKVLLLKEEHFSSPYIITGIWAEKNSWGYFLENKQTGFPLPYHEAEILPIH